MGHSKKTMIEVALVRFPVRLEVAVDKEVKDHHTVCTGPEDNQHDPVRVRQSVACPTCETTHSSTYGFPHRGVERDGRLVVLTAEEIKEAAGEPIKNMELSFHSREKVYAATVAGDSVQNVYPDAGGEKAYKALRDTLAAHPDVVAVTVWAPSTANALWVLEVVDERIVASKRAWPEDVRPATAIPAAEVSDAELEMFSSLVERALRDFDVAEYRNAARHGMAELIASRLGTAVPVTATASSSAPTPAGDMLAALQASLDAAAKTQPVKKAVARKAPAKKTAAKKAVAKKTTTRKKVA